MSPKLISVRVSTQRRVLSFAYDGEWRRDIPVSGMEDYGDLFCAVRATLELAGYRMMQDSYVCNERSIQAEFERDGGAGVTNSFTGDARGGTIIQAGNITHALDIR